jgi:hypothetical protein
MADHYDGPERRSNAEFERLTDEVARLSQSNTQLGNALTSLGTIQQRQMEQEQRTRALEISKLDTSVATKHVKQYNGIAILFFLLLAFSGYFIWQNHKTVEQQRDQRIASLTTGVSNCESANSALDKEKLFLEGLLNGGLPPQSVKPVMAYLANFPKDQDCATNMQQLAKLGHPYRTPVQTP